MNDCSFKVRRILHVVGRMDRAGAESMLMNFYRSVDRDRFQFDFLYYTHDRCDFDEEIERLGGRIVRLPGKNIFSRFVQTWLILRKGPWDIVHSHMLLGSGLNLLVAMLAGVPRRICHAHSTQDSSNGGFVRSLYEVIMLWLIRWVATDRLACGFAAADYLYKGRHQIQIFPNVIDLDCFVRAPDNSSNKLKSDLQGEHLNVLQVGRLEGVKNQEHSLAVADELRRAGQSFRMLFVGVGSDEGRIRTKVNELGLNGYIELLGKREDIPEIMASADVLIMPSKYEGFPLVLIEAQAAGLPALVSDSVSSEVDLGLGLVQFLCLAEPARAWASRVIALSRSKVPDVSHRRAVMERLGFSAQGGAAKLMSLYAES